MGLLTNIKGSAGTLAVLGGLLPLALFPAQAQAQSCLRPILDSSPPPIVETVTNERSTVTLQIGNTSIIRVLPTGSMRPAIQDGSHIILIPPDVRLLVPGRVILFHPPGTKDQRVLHRIYAEGIDSMVPPALLGTSTSGWTLAWDGRWYSQGILPPAPPVEARYWRTWGDNFCLPDAWQIKYKDILGVVVGVIE